MQMPSGPNPDPGFVYQLPGTRPAPVRDLEFQFALQDGGLDPHTSAKATAQTARTSAFREQLGRMARGEQPAPSLLNFINNKTVGDRYSANNAGVLDQNTGQLQASSYLDSITAAADALTAERNANARTANVRGQALETILTDPNMHPAILADAANNRTIASSSRVKVAGPDGRPRYVDATRNLDGSYSYAPAALPGGAPVLAEVGDTDQARDIQNVMRIYNVSEQEAADVVLNRKGKRPADAWADHVAMASRSPATGYGNDEKAVRRQASMLFQMAFPGEPIPTGEARAPAPPPATAQVSGQAETREWQGATYTVGQLISIGGLDYVVTGFFPDGEPDISPIRAPQAN